EPADTISTIALVDPGPAGGSVALYAGWQVDGEPFGAQVVITKDASYWDDYGSPNPEAEVDLIAINEGYVPVPGKLLRAVVNDPGVAYSFWRTPGAPTPVH